MHSSYKDKSFVAWQPEREGACPNQLPANWWFGAWFRGYRWFPVNPLHQGLKSESQDTHPNPQHGGAPEPNVAWRRYLRTGWEPPEFCQCLLLTRKSRPPVVLCNTCANMHERPLHVNCADAAKWHIVEQKHLPMLVFAPFVVNDTNQKRFTGFQPPFHPNTCP